MNAAVQQWTQFERWLKALWTRVQKAHGSLEYRSDLEFLPAALEIIETPPSPIRIWLLESICAICLAAIIWSYLGHVDIVAIAQGKVQPTGRVKLVQPSESGRVVEILVKNGTIVSEGQPVIALDDKETRAEVLSLTATTGALRAEIARRATAINAAQVKSFSPATNWPKDLPDETVKRERRVLEGDLSLLSASLASLEAQRRQKEAEGVRLSNTIASQEKLLAIEEQRLSLRSELETQRLGSKLTVFDAQEALQNQRTNLAQQKGQLTEAQVALDVLERDGAKTVSTFIADNSDKLASAERKLDENVQALEKARAKAERMTLRAPVSGTVQGLSVTSIGQVVMPGEEVMRVVPDEGGYEIECYMPNKDIGFIKVGQQAVVKFEAFPFTRYGTLPGTVMRISSDAIPEPDAQARESDPARAQKSVLLGGAQRMQNLMFPVNLNLEHTTFDVDGAKLPIFNGMAVTVEIKTGNRRIIDYLFSPIVEVASKSIRER